MSEFRISYRPDDEWEGWLEVAVESGGYSGRTGVLGHPGFFADFLKHLQAYPLDPENPPTFMLYETADPEILIRVEQSDAAGHLLLTVRLSEPGGGGNRVQVAIPATYAWLQEFGTNLNEFIEPPHPEVRLKLA